MLTQARSALAHFLYEEAIMDFGHQTKKKAIKKVHFSNETENREVQDLIAPSTTTLHDSCSEPAEAVALFPRDNEQWMFLIKGQNNNLDMLLNIVQFLDNRVLYDSCMRVSVGWARAADKSLRATDAVKKGHAYFVSGKSRLFLSKTVRLSEWAALDVTVDVMQKLLKKGMDPIPKIPVTTSLEF